MAVVRGKAVINNAASMYEHATSHLTRDGTIDDVCNHSRRKFFLVESIERDRPERVIKTSVKGTCKMHAIRMISPIHAICSVRVRVVFLVAVAAVLTQTMFSHGSGNSFVWSCRTSPHVWWSPMRQALKSPMRQALKSPMRQALKSPMRQALKSPMRQALKSPMRQALKSPMRQALKSPMRQALKSPMRRSPQVTDETSPQVTDETSPQVTDETSPQVTDETSPQVTDEKEPSSHR